MPASSPTTDYGVACVTGEGGDVFDDPFLDPLIDTLYPTSEPAGT